MKSIRSMVAQTVMSPTFKAIIVTLLLSFALEWIYDDQVRAAKLMAFWALYYALKTRFELDDGR